MASNPLTEILDDIRHHVVEQPAYGQNTTRDHNPDPEPAEQGNWFSYDGWEPPRGEHDQEKELEKDTDREDPDLER